MAPAIEAGDWLLVDPTITRWPRRGSVVRVPRTGRARTSSVKRVAAGPGDRVAFADGYIELAEDEAWLLSDASDAAAAAAGFGGPIDSRRYGPVPVDLLVGRVWFRYAPLGRIGRDPGRRLAERRAPPRGNPRRTHACASVVGDQRVGKQMIRSSPIAANPPSMSTRAWPASRISSSRV